MTKTDEFRIKENEGVFSVQRKCTKCSSLPPKNYWNYKIENWHTYFSGNEHTKPFIFVDIEGEDRMKGTPILTFTTLDSAKQFITDELKAEVKPTDDVVYHSYP